MANAILVKLPVRTPSATVLLAGVYGTSAVLRVQSGASENGTFSDLTGTGSTPTIAIVSGTETYTAADPNGTSATWYRSRIENADASRLSDWSVSQPTLYP
ncbi:MAG: hypothetical protein A2211_05095 [Rhodanobacter sp. RIFOXYA1_FULL_67_6]|nr:MAG: hypothetical protein A2211_05095 [Rhodanobacter sp. RIFOXYA1_FULL_67_6]